MAVGEMKYGYFSPDILMGDGTAGNRYGLAGCIYRAYFPRMSRSAALALSCPSK
jgi:hypothetical protein